MSKTFLLFIGCSFLLNFNLRSQNLTNEGTDFWIGFTEVHRMADATFEINIVSRVNTTGTVSIQGGSGFTTSFNAQAGVATRVIIPSIDGHNGGSSKIVNRAIHVESIDPISVFALTYESRSHSEASICLPSSSLGSEYMITSYPYRKLQDVVSMASEFVVVCGPAPIKIEIIPTCNTNAGNLAGVPFLVDMLPGEMYQLQASHGSGSDLTGTTIKALNGVDKFAIFSGNKMTPVATGNGCSSPCPLYEVAYPTSTWGYDHIVILAKNQKANIYRLVALRDSCEIFENGKLVGLINSGEVYESTVRNECTFIQTTQKSSVAQLSVSNECSGTRTGDPSMVMLHPNGQMSLDTISFNTALYNGIDKHYVSIITRSDDTTKIIFDDISLHNFKRVLYDSSYSYKILEISLGTHTLTTSGSGMLAYTYGNIFGESYFYSAGASVKNIADTTQALPANVIFPFSNNSHNSFIEIMETNYNQSTYQIAQTLIKNPSLSIDINGYTSTPGDSLYNLQLAADRANTVREYIVQHIKLIYENNSQDYTFNESRIEVRSFGEDLNFLIEKNDNDLINDNEMTRESKQAKNRRVEVVFRYE
jgi:outer membrane protein OmpA-like peptidoglycan-associated protein